MKKLLAIMLFAMSSWLTAQSNFTITTIDSLVSTAGGQGAFGVTAALHNDMIHLVYILKDVNNVSMLSYSVRNAQGSTYEEIMDIGPVLSGGAISAIQFDENDRPFIYLGYITNNTRHVTVFSKSSGVWTRQDIDQNYTPLVFADPNGSDALEFAYWGNPTGANGYIPPVKVAGFDGVTWNVETLNSEKRHKTNATMARFQDRSYVAFGEGRYPDSLITYIYVKDNDGPWVLDFKEVHNGPYGGGGMTGLWMRFGVFNDQLHLLHTLHNTGGQPEHWVNSGNGWAKRSINIDPAFPGLRASNSALRFDSRGTLYWMSIYQGPVLNWIDVNDEGSSSQHLFIDFPFGTNYDFIIDDDELVFYYVTGDWNFPHGDPITFKEARAPLNLLTNDVDLERDQVNNDLLMSPNPTVNEVTISFDLPHNSMVELKIYDAHGKSVLDHNFGQMPTGRHEKIFSTRSLSAGWYTIQVEHNGIYSIGKLIVLR